MINEVLEETLEREEFSWRMVVLVFVVEERKDLARPIEIKGRDENEDVEVVDDDFEVDQESWLVFLC